MTTQNAQRGIWLMIAAVTVFALQDGFSRHLASSYNVFMVIMIRYWFFAAFVIALGLRQPGGLRATLKTKHPVLHTMRAILLIAEVCVIVLGYTKIGLINSHAIFAVCPLLIAGLSVPLLGEKVAWPTWVAIAAGLTGVLIILQPGSGVFTLAALLPFTAATMFALYSLLTRLTTRDEPAFLSLFWSGVIGAVLLTFLGLPAWQPMTSLDWFYMIVYALLALAGNWLLIRCYDLSEASAVQPFAYLQIVLVSIVGIVVYDEILRPSVALGTVVVVSAGLFILLHGQIKSRTVTPS